MSTLRATTLSNVAGTGSPVITAGELSRARFSLNGTGTIAARDSFNIASFTDNGTGDYTSTFSTAMPNADYTFLYGGLDASVICLTSGKLSVPPTVNACRVTTFNGSIAAADVSYITGAFFGDIP